MKYAFSLLSTVLFLSTALISLTIQPAHAYIDPSTGSYIFQLAIAAIVGAGVAMRMFWSNIRSMWASFSSRKKTDSEDPK